MSRGVAAVNTALREENQDELLSSLSSQDVNIHSVTGDCLGGYITALGEAVEESKTQGKTSGWGLLLHSVL